MSTHDLDSKPSLCSPPRLRLRALAHVQTHHVHSGVGNVSSQIQHLCALVSKRGAVRSRVVPFAHMASGSHVVWPDVASKPGVTCPRGVREPGGVHMASESHVESPDVASIRGVTCSRGVRVPADVASKRGVACPTASEPAGIARCGVKTWRHLPTCRHGASWHRQTWRQNMASLAQALPDVASKHGVTCPHGVREPCGVARWHQNVASPAHQLTSPHVASNVASLAHVASRSQMVSTDVASKRGVTCPSGVSGVREPGGVAGAVPAHAISLTWRQAWRQNVASLVHMASESHVASPDVASERGVRRHRATWHRRTWRQYVASIRGVRRPKPPSTCLQHLEKSVFSRGAICAPRQVTPLHFGLWNMSVASMYLPL